MSSIKITSVKTDKKENLINSAMEIFKTKGVANTTVADIAKCACTSKVNFYLYLKYKYYIILKIIMN